MNDEIEKTLETFGWTVTPELSERYETDALVHDLVNALHGEHLDHLFFRNLLTPEGRAYWRSIKDENVYLRHGWVCRRPNFG